MKVCTVWSPLFLLGTDILFFFFFPFYRYNPLCIHLSTQPPALVETQVVIKSQSKSHLGHLSAAPNAAAKLQRLSSAGPLLGTLHQMARMGTKLEHEDQLWWQQTTSFLVTQGRARGSLFPPATKLPFFSIAPQLETRFSLSSPKLTRQKREKNPHFYIRLILRCISSANQLAEGSNKHTLQHKVHAGDSNGWKNRMLLLVAESY